MKKIKENSATGANETTVKTVTENETIQTTDNGTLPPTKETTVVEQTTPTIVTETKPETVTEETTPQLPKVETIEELKQRLEKELFLLEYKKQIAENRETFINNRESLKQYIEVLAGEDNFETKSGKLTFNILKTDNIDRCYFVNTFAVSNTALINKFCKMLLSEIEEKIVSLETDLLTA